jgi:MFS family permease
MTDCPTPKALVPEVHRGRDASVARSQLGLLTTITMCMGIGPLLIYALTATAPLVISELELSRTQFGSFAATAFAAAAVTSAGIGRLVDEGSERATMIVLFAGAGLALVLAAVSGNYLALLFAVVVSGAAQALSNPLTNRLVSTHARPGGRGLLMGVKQSGVQMAQLVAAVAVPSLALLFGWRGALASTAALAIMGIALAWVSVPGSARVSPVRVSRGETAPLPSLVWWLTGHALLSGAALQAVNVYLPLYGYEELGLSLRSAALTAAVVGGVGMAARIAWGTLTERIVSTALPLLGLSLLASVGVLGIILADSASSPPLLWVGAAVFGASGIAANVVLMVAVVKTVPLVSVGRASGVLAIGLYVGFAIGPIAFGAIVDRSSSYLLGWSAVGAAYVANAVLVVLAGYGRPPHLTHKPPPSAA